MESNLVRRVLVAMVGVPLLLSMFWFGGLFLLVGLLGIIAGGSIEFYNFQESKGLHPWKWFGTAASLIWCVWVYHFGIEHTLYPLTVLLSASLVLSLFSRNVETRFIDAVLTIAGTLYVGYLGSFALGVRNFVPTYGSDGKIIAVLILVAIWATDTVAYFSGRLLGKRHPFPHVSPNKTGAGFAGGLVGALGVSVAGVKLTGISLEQGLAMGFIVGIGAQAGDLVASMMKRDAGIKNSSSVFPGHGGFLDRFDSFLFAFPLVYLYLAAMHQ